MPTDLVAACVLPGVCALARDTNMAANCRGHATELHLLDSFATGRFVAITLGAAEDTLELQRGDRGGDAGGRER